MFEDISGGRGSVGKRRKTSGSITSAAKQRKRRSGRGIRLTVKRSAKQPEQPEPRYLKQRDEFRCGPVAIMNVLKWSGGLLSHDNMRDPLTKMCKCTSEGGGTGHGVFDQVLRKFGKRYKSYAVRRVMRPTLAQIEEHLREGGALVLNYCWNYRGGEDRHYSVVVGISDSGRSFRVVNGRKRGRAAKWIRREKFKNWEQRFQRTDKIHKAWFITYKG